MAINATRYITLLTYLANHEVQNILEIGVWRGDTAGEMLRWSKNKEVMYHGVDLFDSPEIDSTSFIAAFGEAPSSLEGVATLLRQTSPNIKLYQGYSRDAFKQVAAQDVKFDLIFIDGDHTYETVKEDFELYSTLLADDGVIFFDDYTDETYGVKKLVNELRVNPLYDITIEAAPGCVNNYRGHDYFLASLRFNKTAEKLCDNCAIVVNTHSSSQDVWPMFFGQLKKFLPALRVYVFSDVASPIYAEHTTVLYNPTVDFRTQYLGCIRQVPEKFCLTMNEDYVLTGIADLKVLAGLVGTLGADDDLDQIRLVKGPNITEKRYTESLFFLDPNKPYWYSQTMTVWRTNSLILLHEQAPAGGIARKNNEPQFEELASHVARKLGMAGVCYSTGTEPKRGLYHHDCLVMPHVCSAIVGGKWNLGEYKEELYTLFKTYRVNPAIRGAV